MPVPRNNGQYVQLDTDLMYLIGLNGVSTNIYLGPAPNRLGLFARKNRDENIVVLSTDRRLRDNTTYYWRVDTDLASYSGFNPFLSESTVYSLGVNLTTSGDASARRLNFTNGHSRTTLDQVGTRVDFGTGDRFQTVNLRVKCTSNLRVKVHQHANREKGAGESLRTPPRSDQEVV